MLKHTSSDMDGTAPDEAGAGEDRENRALEPNFAVVLDVAGLSLSGIQQSLYASSLS